MRYSISIRLSGHRHSNVQFTVSAITELRTVLFAQTPRGDDSIKGDSCWAAKYLLKFFGCRFYVAGSKKPLDVFTSGDKLLKTGYFINAITNSIRDKLLVYIIFLFHNFNFLKIKHIL